MTLVDAHTIEAHQAHRVSTSARRFDGRVSRAAALVPNQIVPRTGGSNPSDFIFRNPEQK
jgi:hypothetical protein